MSKVKKAIIERIREVYLFLDSLTNNLKGD